MNEPNSKAEIFDVFLCHNSEDKPAVREIALELSKKGINPWLDVDQIRPGTSWQTTLGEQIESIKAKEVLIPYPGLNGIVAVDASLGGGSAFQPVTIEEGGVAKERADFPAVDILLSRLEILLDLCFAVLHAQAHLLLLFWRKVFEVELLPRFDAKAGQLRTDFLLFRGGGSELQCEGEVVKEARS